MDFILVSDLHIDVNEYNVEDFNIEENQKRWLLVLGDTFTALHNPAILLVMFMNKCARYFKGVIFLLGNHDYYGNTINGTKNNVNNALAKYGRPNVIFLDGSEPFIIPNTNIKIFGDTLWSCMPPESKEANIEDYMQIHSSIGESHLTFSETNLINKLFLEKIKLFLQSNDGYVKFIATHFPPLMVEQGFRTTWLSSYFHNEHIRHWFDEDYMNDVCWAHGHTHTEYFEKYKNSYIITNARGYSEHKHYIPHLITVD